MEFSTNLSPHLGPQNTVSRVMLQVLLALLPGVLVLFWQYGIGVLINLLIAIITAEVAEMLVLLMRRKPLGLFLGDLSAVVTAVLLALALPPLSPWWLPMIGVLFAILVAKHFYGGLGYNPFNPAMIGYVVLLISFPREMTFWLSPDVSLGLADSWDMVMGNYDAAAADALSSATLLDSVRTGLSMDQTVAQIQALPLYSGAAMVSYTLSVAYLLGGGWLIYRGVIGWHIPAGFLGGLLVISLLFFSMDSSVYPSPVFHLFAGASMLGAFFIATDPVTAATSTRGRVLYGVLIGVLVFVIRSWGGYPDGVAFAVLLINLAVPTIDYYTRPRVFGHS